jgi:hypothetical protein
MSITDPHSNGRGLGGIPANPVARAARASGRLLLRLAHVCRFPNRIFGKDLQLIVVYGAVILAFLEGRKPAIASITRYLQLPHENTHAPLLASGTIGCPGRRID